VLFASVLTSPETRTVAVQLQAFSSAQEGGALPLYGQLMCAAVVSALPVLSELKYHLGVKVILLL
jgi:multiple sugar transport system permease protein